MKMTYRQALTTVLEGWNDVSTMFFLSKGFVNNLEHYFGLNLTKEEKQKILSKDLNSEHEYLAVYFDKLHSPVEPTLKLVNSYGEDIYFYEIVKDGECVD